MQSGCSLVWPCETSAYRDTTTQGCSLVHRPLSDPSRRGLTTHNTLPCSKGIQSVLNYVLMLTHLVIIGGVRNYLHAVLLDCKLFFALLDHGAVSVLCLVCDDEALPREQRVLNGTYSQTQWKVVVIEALPVASC